MLMLLASAMNTVVDAAFVGRLGTAPLAALGMASVYYFTGQVVLLGLMRNSVTFTARAFGEGEPRRIGPIVAHYQWLALFGFPFAWGLAQFFPLVGGLAGLSPQVAAQAQTYLEVRVWESGFLLTLILYGTFYHAIGNSRLPMLIGWGAVGLNIVLDYGLIFGNLGMPALGIRGSALATVIAQALGVGAMLAVTFRPALVRRYGLRLLVRPQGWMLRNIFRIGLAQGLGELVEDVSGFLFFFAVVGRLGEAPLAATNIGVQVIHLLFLPGFAVGIAAGSYMGRLLGVGDPEAAKGATRRTLWLGISYMALMGVPLWFFGGQIARGFTTDPQVIAQAALLFKVMALFQVFDGLGMILRGALNGAGDTRFPVLAQLFTSTGILLPGGWLLSTLVEPALVGAWLGVAACSNRADAPETPPGYSKAQRRSK
jgi:MATE family multidrug resistance protein